MTEVERKDPLLVSTGDIVIFNAELLRVEKLYTLIYLNDYFRIVEDDPHTHVFTIDMDDKTMTRCYSYSDSKEEKQVLYVAYSESAQILDKDISREELLAIHKTCLQERINQFHAVESSFDAARKREATARATLKKHIARRLAGVSDSLYRAASKGFVYVDIPFDLSLVREYAKLPCSDGVVREATDAFCAFVLLGETDAMVPLDFLKEYTINYVRESFPHLSITVVREGKILPTLRLTFASMDTLLC